MKLETINRQLRAENYYFRVTCEYPAPIGDNATFVCCVGGAALGLLYVDSKLSRYLRLGNKFYLCTNADLLNMKQTERDVFLLTMTGELLH